MSTVDPVIELHRTQIASFLVSFFTFELMAISIIMLKQGLSMNLSIEFAEAVMLESAQHDSLRVSFLV
jgi:hypothetical protein